MLFKSILCYNKLELVILLVFVCTVHIFVALKMVCKVLNEGATS